MKNKKKKVNPRDKKTHKDRRHKNESWWSRRSKKPRKKFANKKTRKGPCTKNMEYKKLYEIRRIVF